MASYAFELQGQETIYLPTQSLWSLGNIGREGDRERERINVRICVCKPFMWLCSILSMKNGTAALQYRNF